MAEVKKHEIDMLHSSIWNKLPLFALPVAATAILEQLFNASDIAIVGNFTGDARTLAVAAVGANSPIIGLIVNLFIGIALGANVVIATAIGCGDEKAVRHAVHTSIIFSALGGAVVSLLGQLIAAPLLSVLNVPDDVFPYALMYLRIYLLGMPVILLYNFEAAIFRSVGDTKVPLAALAVSGVLNVLLNLFFVIVCGMSVDGVATATVISQYISLFLVVRCLRRSEGLSHLELKSIRLDREESLRMIQIGLPAGLQSTLFSISNVLIQSSVNSFGASVVAANTAAASIEGFVYTAMNSVFHAAITFTSQNLGARRYDRIWKIFWNCQLTVMLIGVPLCVLSTVFGPQLLSIYVSADDPARDAVIAMGMIRTYYVTTPYFLCGIMEVCCGMVRGLGKSWLPMVVTIFGACVMRIVWIYTIFAWKHTLPALYVSYPISWVITAAMHVVCFVYFWKRIRRKLEQTAPAAADIRKES